MERWEGLIDLKQNVIHNTMALGRGLIERGALQYGLNHSV